MAKKTVKKTPTKTRSSNVSIPARGEKRWEAESAADTLMRATEIQSNPLLHSQAKAVLKQREKQIKKTIGK